MNIALFRIRRNPPAFSFGNALYAPSSGVLPYLSIFILIFAARKPGKKHACRRMLVCGGDAT